MTSSVHAPTSRTSVTTSSRLTVGAPLRELSTISIVCALSSMYAGVLITASSSLASQAKKTGALSLILNTVAVVLVGIALFVAYIVISNAVSGVIESRTRQLMLLRLLGASSKQLRASIQRAALKAASISSIAGLVFGVVLTHLIRIILVSSGTFPSGHYPIASPLLIVAVGAVIASAVRASVVAARTALEHDSIATAHTKKQKQSATLLATLSLAIGGLILLAACAIGERGSAAGLIFAFIGTMFVAAGVMGTAHLLIPRAVSLTGALLGYAAPARIGRRNAVLNPDRTVGATIGIIIGVTFVTTVASGMAALHTFVLRTETTLSPSQRTDIDHVYTLATAGMTAIVAVGAIMSAIGFVGTMSLAVHGRTREIGLLRTLGFTPKQVRAMVTCESLALSITAIVLGVALGVLFGSVGAQSLIGMHSDGIVVALPWSTLTIIVVASAAIVWVSTYLPVRRAVTINPVEAVAME